MRKFWKLVCLLLPFVFCSCLSTETLNLLLGTSENTSTESSNYSQESEEEEAVVSREKATASMKEAAKKQKLYKGEGLAVAVLPPELRNSEAWMQQSFQDNMTSLMARHTEMTILDRKNEDLLIAQQELSETGLYSEENAVEIGRMTNAQYVVVGSVQKLSTGYECNFRVNETATNEVKAASTSRHSLAAIESGVAVRKIVQELFTGLGIELTKEEQRLLQQREDAESTSITMLAKGAEAQSSEDYIQAVLYYNQVSGDLQQEAQSNTAQMLSANQENLTVHQRVAYQKEQKNKWDKIFNDLGEYLDKNLWIGVYDLNVQETSVTMTHASYEVKPGMRFFENREAIIVAKKIFDEWEKIRNNEANDEWSDTVSWSLDSATGSEILVTVGLFDGDDNLLEKSEVIWIADIRIRPSSHHGWSDDYVIKSQKRYYEDARNQKWNGGSYIDWDFKIDVSTMSENTVLPTVKILEINIKSSNYSNKKRKELTLYSKAEWDALMAGK